MIEYWIQHSLPYPYLNDEGERITLYFLINAALIGTLRLGVLELSLFISHIDTVDFKIDFFIVSIFDNGVLEPNGVIDVIVSIEVILVTLWI